MKIYNSLFLSCNVPVVFFCLFTCTKPPPSSQCCSFGAESSSSARYPFEFEKEKWNTFERITTKTKKWSSYNENIFLVEFLSDAGVELLDWRQVDRERSRVAHERSERNVFQHTKVDHFKWIEKLVEISRALFSKIRISYRQRVGFQWNSALPSEGSSCPKSPFGSCPTRWIWRTGTLPDCCRNSWRYSDCTEPSRSWTRPVTRPDRSSRRPRWTWPHWTADTPRSSCRSDSARGRQSWLACLSEATTTIGFAPPDSTAWTRIWLKNRTPGSSCRLWVRIWWSWVRFSCTHHSND